MTEQHSEQYLENLQRRRDPESIPQLVATVRQQQHALDSLRLSLEVARRDREELRAALLGAQAEVRWLRARLAELQPEDGEG